MVSGRRAGEPEVAKQKTTLHANCRTAGLQISQLNSMEALIWLNGMFCNSDLFGLERRESEVKSTLSTKKTIWLQEGNGAPV